MKTIFINFISGPGVGKTTMAAKLFYEMKILNLNVEYVQEYAKILVWKKKYNKLNNQYLVSKKQIKLMKSLKDKVKYVITDGPIIHGLYYNKYNKNNISNKTKVKELIFKYLRKTDNFNIYLKRNELLKYDKRGREQTKLEAKYIDKKIINILKETKENYIKIKIENKIDENIKKIINQVLKKGNKNEV